MTDWFAKLMQEGHARSRPAVAGIGRFRKADGPIPDVRADRHAAIIRALRAREAADRSAREKRLAGYRQSPESGASAEGGASDPVSEPSARLYRFPTKVPCRVTPAARVLLEALRRECPGGSVAFQQLAGGRQAVMLTEAPGAEPRQIGRIEHCVQTDPLLCSVRHQGLTVDTDGDAMLVLRFLYPATAVSRPARREGHAMALRTGPASAAAFAVDPAVVAGPQGTEGTGAPGGATTAGGFSAEGHDQPTCVDFTELRPALDMSTVEGGALPPLVMLAAHEIDLINAAGGREYEAFYTRFKHEVLGGVWNALSGLLLNSPGSRWHRGSHLTLLREPDPQVGRIRQTTVADDGRVVDVGLDRVYDASAATDLLVLHLAGDILADITEIFFAIQRLGQGEAKAREEEFFSLVRRFWSGAQSLASPFGGDPAAVVRMALRALPTPVQASLLRSDWTALRQMLVSRYGERGRDLPDLPSPCSSEPPDAAASWPFATYPAGEINVGLRLVYRQEWRFQGSRSEVIRSLPLRPKDAGRVSVRVARATGASGATDGAWPVVAAQDRRDSSEDRRRLVLEAVEAVAGAMKWAVDVEGAVNIGQHGLAASTDSGLESERRESSRHAGTRITDGVLRVTRGILGETDVVVNVDTDSGDACPSAEGLPEPLDEVPTLHVFRRLLNEYDVLTRLSEVQNVLMVAEALPDPAEIGFWWVRRHQGILAGVLLEESCRGALDAICRESSGPGGGEATIDLVGGRDTATTQVDTFAGTVSLRAESIDMVGEWKRGRRENVGEWQTAAVPATRESVETPMLGAGSDAERGRLYEHIRANILHYQRAIWQAEDPQQRAMRYRKSGKKVPLEWRFELRSRAGLTMEELSERLVARSVDGQFSAYAGGPEVSLDQVIDPARPIGYHGNCAVYLMRPEFASDEAFSMLHFFRSPYLRPDLEEGIPEIADPVLIQISEDPDVAAVTNQVLERSRDSMIRLIPELRGELLGARLLGAGGTAGGGGDPDGAERSRRQYARMRRHYAEYLFRRAHSRRVVLDARRVVLEQAAGRGAAAMSSHGGMGLMAASDEPDLWAVRTARDGGALRTHGHRGGDAEPAIVPGRHAGLSAGVGAVSPLEPEPEPDAGIVVSPGRAAPGVIAGVAVALPTESDPEPVLISAPDPGLVMTLLSGTPSALPHRSEPGTLMLPPAAGEAVSLVAGTGALHPQGSEVGSIAVAGVAGRGATIVIASVGAAPRLRDGADPAMRVESISGPGKTIVSGAGHHLGAAPGPAVMLPPVRGREATGSIAGARSTPSAAAASAPGILVRGGRDVTGTLLAGVGTGQPIESHSRRLIIVPSGGGSEPTVVSGALAA